MKRLLSFITTFILGIVALHAQTFTYDVINSEDNAGYKIVVDVSSREVSATSGGRSAFRFSYYDYDLDGDMISFAFRQGRAPLFKLKTALEEGEKCVIIKENAIGCYNPSTDIAYNLVPSNSGSFNSTYSRMINTLSIAKLNDLSYDNIEESFKWVLKVAETSEDAELQKTVGDCYYNGVGVVPNSVEAAKWYQLSAAQGNAEAIYCLGECYEYGRGVTKNEAKAKELYEISAERGVAGAEYKMGVISMNEKRYTEAVNWYYKSAEHGNSEAQYELGHIYTDGLKKANISKDADEALKWFLKAAEQGLDKAQLAVGDIYAKKKDYAEAAKWYSLAADQRYPHAQDKLEAVLKKL